MRKKTIWELEGDDFGEVGNRDRAVDPQGEPYPPKLKKAADQLQQTLDKTIKPSR